MSDNNVLGSSTWVDITREELGLSKVPFENFEDKIDSLLVMASLTGWELNLSYNYISSRYCIIFFKRWPPQFIQVNMLIIYNDNDEFERVESILASSHEKRLSAIKEANNDEEMNEIFAFFNKILSENEEIFE